MEDAYDRIRDQVMTLRLRPGAWIDDAQLAQELGLSRTPVREALFALASEGLVLARPRGGFTVRAIDLVDVSRLFEAHVVAAKAVARLTATRIGPGDVADLRDLAAEVKAAIAARDPARIAAFNARLHRAEAQLADNEYLKRMACQIHDQGQRLGYLAFGGADDWAVLRDHFARVQRDHDELIDAYAAADPDVAESIATRHVYLFRSRIQAFFETSGAADGLELTGLPMPDLICLVDSDHSRSAVDEEGELGTALRPGQRGGGS